MGLQHADKGGAAKPEWWNDEELKAFVGEGCEGGA